MSRNSIGLAPDLYEYLLDTSLREPEVLADLREETAGMAMAGMQISPDEGQLLGLLAELTNVRLYLEIGTFTGYSALSVVLAMPPDGRVVACDVSEEYTTIAQKYWQRAGVADRIDLRLGPATETLERLIDEGRAGDFDMAFIDADKGNYPLYYEATLELVRSGGLICLDNVLWSGRVADPSITDPRTEMFRDLNTRIRADTRVTMALLPIGDGLTLARKR